MTVPNPEDRAVLPAAEAFKLLGINRATGYRAIRDGTFPVPVIQIGRALRVPTAALRQVLGLPVTEVPDEGVA